MAQDVPQHYDIPPAGFPVRVRFIAAQNHLTDVAARWITPVQAQRFLRSCYSAIYVGPVQGLGLLDWLGTGSF